MNQEPILKYEPKDKGNIIRISTIFQHVLLFFVGTFIGLITNLIANGTYTYGEINYASFTLSSDIFADSSIFTAFILVIKQNLIEFILVLLIPPVSITIFSKSLISFMLILKAFAFCRYAGLLINLCNRSTSAEVLKRPVLSTVIALLAAVVYNIIFIYMCDQAHSFSEYIFKRKDDTELSLLLSQKTSIFTQTYLTVLGSVIIISIFKTFLLWIASVI